MTAGQPVAVPEDPFAGLPKTRSVARVAAVWATYKATQEIITRAQHAWHQRAAYTVTVKDSDPMYSDVHEWVLSLMPTTVQRSLAASSAAPTHGTDTLDQRPSRLRLSHDSTRPRKIRINTHRVSVRVNKPEHNTNRDSFPREPETIQFTARTREAQEAVLGRLAELIATRTDRRPALRTVTAWGGWSQRVDMPPRPWKSVVINQAQKDNLEADLERFLTAEDDYMARGIPWHRGYLFAGPPGTGKTSLAKALADRFGLDVWCVPLTDLTKDASLMSLLAEVSPRSVLLIEDVDTVTGARDRDDTGPGLSTGTLLNALDGIGTPHGLITVMTTNRLDTLDPALTRAGRMDVVEQIGFPGPDEIRALFHLFYGNPPTTPLDGPAVGHLSQAEVAEALKPWLTSPTDGETALRELLATAPKENP